MAENNVILQVQDVTMQFGGLRAIDNVSFHVDEAEIFGLIGPNGAGKTTLFNVITANYKPTSGSVTLAGTSLKGLKPNHDMPFVNRLCERVMVLEYGKPLFSGLMAEAIQHPDVISAYLGEANYA